MIERGASDDGQLQSRVVRGLSYSLLNTTVGRVGTFITGLLLARLLSPEDYGLFAIAQVVLLALLSFNELGVSLALVKWDGDPRRIAPTVATMSLAWSLVLAAGCFVLAPVLADSFEAPEATWMIRVLSTCVVADAVTAIPAAVMSREFMQGRRAALDFSSFVVSTSLTLLLAWQGWGAWSLVIGRFAGAVWNVASFTYFAPFRFRFGWDRALVRPLLAFGLPLAGASLLVFVMASIDSIVVGAVLGPTALGLYFMAANLAMWPVNVISSTLRRVSFAGFAAISTQVERVSAYRRALPSLVLIALPISIGLSLLSEPIIRLLYGSKWAESAPILTALAWVAMGKILLDFSYDYLVGSGRNRRVLSLQVAWLIVLAPILTVAAQEWGVPQAVAAGSAVVMWGAAVPMYLASLSGTGVSLPSLVATLARPALAGLGLATSVLVVKAVAETQLQELVFSILVGAAVYLAITRSLLLSMLATVRGGYGGPSGVVANGAQGGDMEVDEGGSRAS